MKLARQFVASDVVWRPCIGVADLSHFSRVKSLPGQHLVLNEDTLPMVRNGLLEAGNREGDGTNLSTIIHFSFCF